MPDQLPEKLPEKLPKKLSVRPLPYQPSFEIHAPDEAETQAELVRAMKGICETTFKDYGHAVRSVHAKSHALLQGELRVLDGLPAELAQGVFAAAATYPVVMRISTVPGDLLDDSVSTPRGLAVKLIGVTGERLPGSEGQVTQDFIMVNGPAFSASDPKAFLGNLKLLAATTDTPQVFKKAISAALRGAEAVVESFGSKSAKLLTLGGQPETHPLGDTFYTQVPLLHGPYMAKLSIAPVSPELTALTDAPLDVNGKPNGLREAAVAFFAEHGGEWEMRVQLCADLKAMPIEDASVQWPEDLSPYVAVARIKVAPQPAWADARSAAVDDGMAFSPWHGIAAHRPIGAVMRARKAPYEMSAGFRATQNGCPIREPRVAEALPG